jgi:hypothetical protein
MLADMLFQTTVVVSTAELFRFEATIYLSGSLPETEVIEVSTDAGVQNARDCALEMLRAIYPNAEVIEMGGCTCLSE